jgi:hypothetical protein
LLTPAAILHTVIRSLLIIEMLSKSFAAFIFLLALTFFFNAEAIIIPALGASGTKEVSDVIRLIAQNLDTSETVQADSSGKF